LDGDWGPISSLYKPPPRSVSTVKATYYTTIQKREKSLNTTILSTKMAQAENNITELSREYLPVSG